MKMKGSVIASPLTGNYLLKLLGWIVMAGIVRSDGFDVDGDEDKPDIFVTVSVGVDSVEI